MNIPKLFNKYKTQITLLLIPIFLWLAIFLPQTYLALNPGCCIQNYWYQIPYYIRYFGTGINGNLVTLDGYNTTSSYLNVWDSSRNNIATRYLPVSTGAHLFQDPTGNVIVFEGNTVSVYSGANLILINSYTFPSNWTIYSNFAETTTIKYDGNLMYLYTLVRPTPTDGKIYVAKVYVTGGNMPEAPVALINESDLYAAHSISALEYNPFDASLNVLYSPNIGTYNLRKYSVDFAASTSTLDSAHSYNMNTVTGTTWQWFKDLDIDSDGNYYVSAWNKIYAFDSNGNLLPKTSDFRDISNYRVEIGSDGKLYQQTWTTTYPQQVKIASYGPKTDLIVTGLSSGMQIIEGTEYTYMLKLSQAPSLGNIAIDVTPTADSNIQISIGGNPYSSTATALFNNTNWSTGIPVNIKYLGGKNETTLETIVHSVNVSQTTTGEDCILGANTAITIDKKNALIDPPKVMKSGINAGAYLEWEIWASNTSYTNTDPVEYKLTDPLSSDIDMDMTSISCIVKGTSTSTSCYYDNVSRTVVWIGMLSPDGDQVNTFDEATNGVMVSFRTSLPKNGVLSVNNTGTVITDTQLDGDIDSNDISTLSNEVILGIQETVSSSSSTTTTTTVEKENLANTGYSYNYVTVIMILSLLSILFSLAIAIKPRNSSRK